MLRWSSDARRPNQPGHAAGRGAIDTIRVENRHVGLRAQAGREDLGGRDPGADQLIAIGRPEVEADVLRAGQAGDKLATVDTAYLVAIDKPGYVGLAGGGALSLTAFLQS